MKIILASGSPRRLDLLTTLGHDVDVIVPTVEELDERAGLTPDRLALANAQLKARSVAEVTALERDAVVLAADTVVVLQDAIFGKPKNYDDAFAMLRKLSGAAHEVITAYTLIGPGRKEVSRAVSSIVDFRTLDDGEIKAYLRTDEWRDKAGAYGVQGLGAALCRRVKGSITNVIGLPIEEVMTDACKLFHHE